jgi:acetolactate synthase-1/2/3 large subunit
LDGIKLDEAAVAERRSHYASRHKAWADALMEKEQPKAGITPEYLTACVRRATDRDTVIVNEGITNYSAINNHTMCTQPGTRFTSGASSLGWPSRTRPWCA